jgi:prepilin-type N-terminal cleavage/methylation domain-containing protein
MEMSKAQKQRLHNQHGFTLVELLVVVAIIMVISAFALPIINKALANIRERATATNVNGLIQQLRMQAVRDNRSYTMRVAVVGGVTTLYIDSILPSSPNVLPNGQYDAGEPSVPIPNDTVISNGTGGPATVPPNVAFPPYINFATNGLMSFNERGLPCSNPPACNTLAPYIIYLQQTRNLSVPGWASITVTQAGRVKAYTYQPGTPAPSWY